MKFFNRKVIAYALLALAATVSYYYYQHQVMDTDTHQVLWPFLAYLAVLFGGAYFISSRDEHGAYMGFNYHLTAYLISNGIPLLATATGMFPKEMYSALVTVLACWGIGLLFHFLMFSFVHRKKSIGSYEKDEVFK